MPKRHRIIFTKKASDGTFITRKLLKQGYKNIVAVGGDGTLNEIANGFFETKRMNRVPIDYKKFKPTARLTPTNPKGILWITPSGSRNVLAASLGLQYQGNESHANKTDEKSQD